MRPLASLTSALALLLLATPAAAQVRLSGPLMDRVDVEAAYVKYYTLDPKTLEARFSPALKDAIRDIEVEEKEWYQRWRANSPAYKWITTGPGKVKAHVKREVQVGKLLQRLMDKVGPKTDFAALAKKHGLAFHRYSKVMRAGLQQHRDIGNPRVALMVWGTGVDKLGKGGFKLGHVVPYVTKTPDMYWPRIFDEPGNFMAIFRLMKYYPDPRKKK